MITPIEVQPDDRQMYFSAAMARLVRQRVKTQTRRIITEADVIVHQCAYRWKRPGLRDILTRDAPRRENLVLAKKQDMLELVEPRYQPGDSIWVREPIYARGIEDTAGDVVDCIAYEADDELAADPYINGTPQIWDWEPDQLPSIFMPKKLCRTRLRVIDSIAQRIQDISLRDIDAEGVDALIDEDYSEDFRAGAGFTRHRFARLWDNYNGHREGGSFEENPPVRRVRFEIIETASRGSSGSSHTEGSSSDVVGSDEDRELVQD